MEVGGEKELTGAPEILGETLSEGLRFDRWGLTRQKY